MKTFKPPVAVSLVTGLLGSGKTTLLQKLLRGKPQNETWGLLINDFGEIGIDASSLSTKDQQLPLVEVNGGCLCCTAFQGYQQALSSLLSQKVDRILIEPTGLGHPAKIIDLLKQPAFKDRIHIAGIIGIVTAQHLTPERWQKSAIMRDIITLCDTLIINKIDLASPTDISLANQVLQTLYPAKQHTYFTQLTQDSLPPCLVDFKQTERPFYLLSGLQEHAQQTEGLDQTFNSELPHCTQTKLHTGTPSTIGWIFDADLYFHRTKLIHWLSHPPLPLLRAKGLVKTGHEWQHLNVVDQQIELSDIAWRQDSRLELILDCRLDEHALQTLERNLQAIVFTRDKESPPI